MGGAVTCHASGHFSSARWGKDTHREVLEIPFFGTWTSSVWISIHEDMGPERWHELEHKPLCSSFTEKVCSNLEPGCGSRRGQKQPHRQTHRHSPFYSYQQSFSKNYFRAQHDNNQKEGPSHQGHSYNLVQCVYQLIGHTWTDRNDAIAVVRVPTLLIQGRLPYGTAISFSPTVTVLWKGIFIPCCRWGKWSLGWLSNRFRLSQLGSVDLWFKHGFSWPQNPRSPLQFLTHCFSLCFIRTQSVYIHMCIPSQVPNRAWCPLRGFSSLLIPLPGSSLLVPSCLPGGSGAGYSFAPHWGLLMVTSFSS